MSSFREHCYWKGIVEDNKKYLDILSSYAIKKIIKNYVRKHHNLIKNRNVLQVSETMSLIGNLDKMFFMNKSSKSLTVIF